ISATPRHQRRVHRDPPIGTHHETPMRLCAPFQGDSEEAYDRPALDSGLGLPGPEGNALRWVSGRTATQVRIDFRSLSSSNSVGPIIVMPAASGIRESSNTACCQGLARTNAGGQVSNTVETRDDVTVPLCQRTFAGWVCRTPGWVDSNPGSSGRPG